MNLPSIRRFRTICKIALAAVAGMHPIEQFIPFQKDCVVAHDLFDAAIIFVS
ncbi:hypothetical protein [Granulicella tundricola]|uniref:hypothetical protein n=1 Tax=Granulicella tundricola TaxID=940615 RepID=UPI0018DEC1D9|nr:hypothetical protein [Granulicella tundricola]